MMSREVFSDDPLDRYIGINLRNWARSVPPPADGRARLLETLRDKPWDRSTVKMSLMLLLRVVTFEILTPPIAPTVQPVLYSDRENELAAMLLLDSKNLTAQMLSQISGALGAGVFSLIA